MNDLVLGILALLIGAVLCFRGYAALRVVIAAWGAFAGFVLGAGLVAQFTGEGFLGSVLAWVVGIAVGLVFALIAYLYYAVSVIIGMGAIGFTLGSTLMVALGARWNWAIVLVGILVGVALALVAIVGDLPLVILAFLGAFAGASAMLGGVLLLFGSLNADELAAETPQMLELGWPWYAAYVVLGLVGLFAQFRDVDARRGTLRDAWVA